MAGDKRFMNFLNVGGVASTRAYGVVNRVICEFVTQILGWTLYDSSGSAWTNVVASGTSADTTSDPDKLDMTGSGRSWSSGDVGMLFTLYNCTDLSADTREKCNGIFRIKQVLDSNTIKVDIKRGIHSLGLVNGQTNLSWRLWDQTSTTYEPSATDWVVYRVAYSHAPSSPNFDIYHKVGTADNTWQLLPRFELGPYGTWNSGTHTWNDSRNTTTITMGNAGASVSSTTIPSMFAVGDDDHVWFWWNNNISTTVWHCLGLGQIIDPFYPGDDTNPAAIFYAGENMAYATPHKLVGYESSGSTHFANKLYFLADDDGTTITGRLCVPSCGAKDDGTAGTTPIWRGAKRRVSRWSNGYVRADILAESRTTSHWEMRGKLIDMHIGGAYPPFCRPFGTPSDPPYIAMFGGLSHPWHGSDVLYTIPYTFDWLIS